MTKRGARELIAQEVSLMNLGISRDDSAALHRISMTLRRWHELECGMGNSCIERDETTNKPYWLDSHSMQRSPIADRESGALKRLKIIMARYPQLTAYVQSDPRGCALYILTAEQISGIKPEYTLDSIYTQGVAVG